MRQAATQAFRFAVVGLAATATHVVVALALAEAAGVTPFLANLCAFAVALGVSYAGNHAWTFAATGRHGRHFPRFVAVAVPALLLNQVIVYVTVERWDLDFRIALVIVVLVVPVLSLILNRFWVFAGVRPRPGDSAPVRGR